LTTKKNIVPGEDLTLPRVNANAGSRLLVKSVCEIFCQVTHHIRMKTNNQNIISPWIEKTRTMSKVFLKPEEIELLENAALTTRDRLLPNFIPTGILVLRLDRRGDA
jgi:hypothetical protein